MLMEPSKEPTKIPFSVTETEAGVNRDVSELIVHHRPGSRIEDR